MQDVIFGTSHQLESYIRWRFQPLQDTLIYMLGVAAQSLKAREVPQLDQYFGGGGLIKHGYTVWIHGNPSYPPPKATPLRNKALLRVY